MPILHVCHEIGEARFHLVAGMVSGVTKSNSDYFMSHQFQLSI